MLLALVDFGAVPAFGIDPFVFVTAYGDQFSFWDHAW
jgi:hypothetical protein